MKLNQSDIESFILAGKARFTVLNPQTGKRFTYQIKTPKNNSGQPIYFVSLLTGPENTNNYSYFGFIRNGMFVHGGAKSRIGRECQSVQAFTWFWNNRNSLRHVEVYHEGRCGRCGRVLTVPESITSGLGPECIKMAG